MRWRQRRGRTAATVAFLASVLVVQGGCAGKTRERAAPLDERDATPDARVEERTDGADPAVPPAPPGPCQLDPETGALILEEDEFCALAIYPMCQRDIATLRAPLFGCHVVPEQNAFAWRLVTGCGVASIGFHGGYTGVTNHFDEATGEWIGAEAFSDVSRGRCDPGKWQTGRRRTPCGDEVYEECDGPVEL